MKLYVEIVLDLLIRDGQILDGLFERHDQINAIDFQVIELKEAQ